MAVFEKDGSICLMPVAVYPKKCLNELKEEISGVKAANCFVYKIE